MTDIRPTVKNDDAVAKLIAGEEVRQKSVIELIPSRNYVSDDVLTALGDVFTNKYSEGYPGRALLRRAGIYRSTGAACD